ncbi:hypothetical protein [Endozoicomonas numazuensis]|nr:hypothetical protein [Endozoicomonas numazuensis]
MSLVEKLQAFESGIDVDKPEQSRIPYRIIGAGSTSLGMTIAAIPDKLIRRLPGFYSFTHASDHIHQVHTYREKLHALGIQTTDTQLVALEEKRHTWGERLAGGQGVVYVIQPLLNGQKLAKKYLQKASEKETKDFFHKQFQITQRIFEYNKDHPGNEVTLDIVLNNWEVHFTGKGEYVLRLNDLAQPLYSVDGKQPYEWYDQATSLIFPLNRDAQKELVKHFEKLLEPRKYMIELLWGYDLVTDHPERSSIAAMFENSSVQNHNCTPDELNQPGCKNHYYPDWALNTVNLELERLKDDQPDATERYKKLTGEEVYLSFLNNNYALSCLRLYRGLSHSIRHYLSYLRFSNSIHIQKPEGTPVDMYQTSTLPGYWECFRDPDIKYHPSPR